MGVVASQHNYATPIYNSILNPTATPQNKLYFSLASNKLDGTYFPIEGDVGLWGSVASDANGAFSTPVTITVSTGELGEPDIYSVEGSVTVQTQDIPAMLTVDKAASTYPWDFCGRDAELRVYSDHNEIWFNLDEYSIVGTNSYGSGSYTSGGNKIMVQPLVRTYVDGNEIEFRQSIPLYADLNLSTAHQTAFSNWRLYNTGNPAIEGGSILLDGTTVKVVQGGNIVSLGSPFRSVAAFLYTKTADAVPVPDVLHTVRVCGDAVSNNYPVDFTVTFYDADDAVVFSTSVAGNTLVEYTELVDTPYLYVYYIVSITKISQPNSVAKITNVYNPHILASTDSTNLVETLQSLRMLLVSASDSAVLTPEQTSKSIHAILYPTSSDNWQITEELTSVESNVHTAMRSMNRTILGKLAVTYVNPFTPGNVEYNPSSSAHNNGPERAADGYFDDGIKYFTLYDNKLDGSYKPISSKSKVAWASAVLSDASGAFATPQVFSMSFASAILIDTVLYGDSARNNYPVDFTVTLTLADTSQLVYAFSNNANNKCQIFEGSVSDVVNITVSITKISQPYMPASISEIPIFSTIQYGSSDLVSMELLEELSYNDDIKMLGGISANELTVKIDNSAKSFYFNNPDSLVANQLKKNRKVEAWLGTIFSGIEEWHKLGTFWVYSWEVPTNSIYASVVAFDTIALLGKGKFYKHTVYENYSIGDLVEIILDTAKETMTFIEYNIADALYDITIPLAWFKNDTYLAALSRLASSYPFDVYCDRAGVIQVVTRIFAPSEFDTAWSNSDTIIKTSYPTRYTTPVNSVDIKVYTHVIASQTVLSDTEATSVDTSLELEYVFSLPVKAATSVVIDADLGITYTYDVYSWGMIVNYTGTGTIRSVTVTADAIQSATVVTCRMRDQSAILQNGMEALQIDSELVQSKERAEYLATLMLGNTNSVYNAEVLYTGDIAVTLNNSIWLKEGLVPPNYYSVKRHTLFWAGYLSGNALLVK
jgi:hypothetical protein